MTLDYLHPVWAVAVYAAAILGARLWLRAGARLEPPGRYAAVDGLRGLLALGVFVCHVAVWYRYSLTGIWRNSPSPLYLYLGEASVVMFFMVTGFLFWGKVLDGRAGGLDWGALYRSRWFRIVPLYLLALLLLASIVALASGFVLRVSPATLAWQCLSWLGFTLTGRYGLNGFGETIPLLGVAWTLIYEWLFYFSLPLLAGLAGMRVPPRWTLLGAALTGFILLAIWRLDSELLPSFLFGMAAAHMVRKPAPAAWMMKPWTALMAVLAVVLAARLFPQTAYQPMAETLLFLAFATVACGNTLWGLLTTAPLRLLGQISYSLYLLHSFLLYLLFGVLVRHGGLPPLSPWQHWALALLLIPLLIGFCYLTWRWIEAPWIAHGHRAAPSGAVARPVAASSGA